jgi:hypothetical protein
MPIEKAFAIRAPMDAIYAALERDLSDASQHAGETFEIIRRDPPRTLELRVTIGGVPCWLTYSLAAREDDTEVAARLTPFGWKYTLFRIMTFGMRDQGYEVALVEGLANLKAEVEDAEGVDGADEMAKSTPGPAPGE